jgi:hypothetical protein
MGRGEGPGSASRADCIFDRGSDRLGAVDPRLDAANNPPEAAAYSPKSSQSWIPPDRREPTF